MPTINPGLPTARRYTWRAPKPTQPTPEMRAATELRAMNRELGERVRTKATRHLDAEWTCGDGKRIRVQAMSDSHLHFALAKAYRAEYPDARSRQTGVEALHSEALRRLAGVAGTQAQHEAQHAALVQRWNDEALARMAAGY